MRRRSAIGIVLVGLVVAVGLLAWNQRPMEPAPDPLVQVGSVLAPRLDPPRSYERRGGLDVTFIVASDTHLGHESEEHDWLGRQHDPVKKPRGVELVNAQSIAAMHRLPGTSWPAPLRGTIAEPRGVLVCGDLTENGDPWQWRHFVAYYGLRGGDGVLRWPVYEAYGNHDKHHSWHVLDRIRERHGGWRYSFDWDDLHLINLGEAADDEGLAFLARDLEKVGRERPVVVYQHFPMKGPYSEDNWFGRGDYRARFARALEPYNVVAVFHGHYHASGRYRWSGLDIYNVGAAKHRQHSFAIVRITDTTLRVASYQHDHRQYEWLHEKPINGAPGPERHGGPRPDQGLILDPEGR
jgi:cytolysin (calcineurin-like family phosphatase)